MHKCYGCGQMFDGSVCPVCGKKFQDEKTKIKSVKKLYSVFYYLSPLLLMLFAILLFAFFALPVAISPGGEIMGETVPSESYGNIYRLGFGASKELEKLKAPCISVIVIAALALIYSVVAGDVRAITSINNKKIEKIKLGDLLSYLGVIFYVEVFIVGCIICGTISKLDEGMGIITAGACPILLIVLSVLFALLSIGISVVNGRLISKYPVLKDLDP